jgi:hypothetical protein
MWLLSPFLLVLGFWLPGFFIAKYLRQPLAWAAAFPFSLLVLFHSIFWLGILHAPLALISVLPCLLAASALAAWLSRKSPVLREAKKTPWSAQERLLLVSSAVVGAVLLARSAISPLIGYDTRFRWDFLAQRMLGLGKFDFYPPVTPADFHTYFYVDGIPPLVSFTHWWLYTSAGEYLPVLICILVSAQFACTLIFTYGTASALYSRRAGVLAAAILAACPLFFRSVALGQETGLTALSIVAMLYFIVTASESGDVRGMVCAGFAAALCALAREYGWVAVIAGALALAWRRQPWKQIIVFAAVAGAAAAPWYIRNWAITGNPLYSISFAGFPVNPIHVAILQQYGALLGLSHWTPSIWLSLVPFLLAFAAIPFLAGIPGGFARFRQQGYLIVIALLLAAVWLQSVGYTSGGLPISTRVLSPAMVVLSITAAGWLAPFLQRAPWSKAILAIILVLQAWTAAQGVVYTPNPDALPLKQWSQNVFQKPLPEREYQISDELVKYWPPGTRVLTDNAHVHAALIDKGVDVVPVWSPEVRFIFSLPAEEAERQLRALRIENIAYYPRSLNTRYLVAASPLYASLPKLWRIRAQDPGSMYLLVPK